MSVYCMGITTRKINLFEQVNKQIQANMVCLIYFYVGCTIQEEMYFEKIMNTLDNSSNTEIYHVLGSASYDPKNVSKEWYDPSPNTKYNKIILGFKIDQGLSRWLFQEEISDGTVKAIESKLKEFVIGQIEPWDMRP